MKTSIFYLGLIMLTFFLSCDKQSTEIVSLEQTFWKGEISSVNSRNGIKIFFTTNTNGYYVLDKKEITEEEFVITFTYEIINDKYLSVAGSGENVLFGDWIIVKTDDNKMIMKNELGTKNGRTLIISKTNY
ncbi:hypothetical protein [Proteiniphilum propionicum]|jgi:hypothetical protein|uniref:hypothetical protein n=1 Tax=Proteiniphilum propionicum TaxID=2829812 RepID=UPI001EEB10D7|nr:hypothetical protein [Proteiniphilum propionicum]ULB35517.1 hypothetical protein KDN43_05635 [Proteiniphilum propionicum]